MMVNTIKREEILKAAQRLFAHFGLKKITTDDIAREARVSKATIYKLYKNKAEIFDEVVRVESEQLLSLIQAAVDAETTCVGKFRAHLLTKMSKVRELINFYHVTQEGNNEFWPHIAEARRSFMTAEKALVTGILEQGNKSGELDVTNMELVAHMIVVSLRSQEYEWAIEGLQTPLDRYVDFMLEVMLNGIRKR